jgi:hypothetical protein
MNEICAGGRKLDVGSWKLGAGGETLDRKRAPKSLQNKFNIYDTFSSPSQALYLFSGKFTPILSPSLFRWKTHRNKEGGRSGNISLTFFFIKGI